MRRTGRTLAALAAIGTTLALTPAASAQEVTPKFTLESESALGPNSFKTFTSFGVIVEEGTCPGGPASVESNGGFWTPVQLISMRGTFGKIGGTYTATLKCKDTTKAGTVTFQLTEPKPRTDPFLDKAEYAPGETITIHLDRGYKCGLDKLAHSEGFTEPAALTPGGTSTGYDLRGRATAVDKPGTYEAKIRCLQDSVVNTFTIKPKAATPPPGLGPKPPIVKPKGAPETGGGGTA
ncbi:hypothetical protein LFM09_05390 [Lentzea alba]|uniref:hypothetical protein n=1 Tax=Lentzea alba TaxID=2714351 RepID=UPI0039BED78D